MSYQGQPFSWKEKKALVYEPADKKKELSSARQCLWKIGQLARNAISPMRKRISIEVGFFFCFCSGRVLFCFMKNYFRLKLPKASLLIWRLIIFINTSQPSVSRYCWDMGNCTCWWGWRAWEVTYWWGQVWKNAFFFCHKLALVGIIPNQILFSFSSDKDWRTDSRIRRTALCFSSDLAVSSSIFVGAEI